MPAQIDFITNEPMISDILKKIRSSSAKRRLYLQHAVKQMARPERMIRIEEVTNVIEFGHVIEDYPEDPRGHSALMMGTGIGGRPVHVVCSPKEDYLAIITAYLPDEREWSDGCKKRSKR